MVPKATACTDSEALRVTCPIHFLPLYPKPMLGSWICELSSAVCKSQTKGWTHVKPRAVKCKSWILVGNCPVVRRASKYETFIDDCWLQITKVVLNFAGTSSYPCPTYYWIPNDHCFEVKSWTTGQIYDGEMLKHPRLPNEPNPFVYLVLQKWFGYAQQDR